MAPVVPVLRGYTTHAVPSGTTAVVYDPTVNRVNYPLEVGDWIFVVLQSSDTYANTKKPTPPPGWSTLVPFGQVGAGTTTLGVYAKQRLAGETTYTWTRTTSEVTNFGFKSFWVKDAGPQSNWVIGNMGVRAVTGNSTQTTAPGIDLPRYTLGILIAAERTIASETLSQITVGGEYVPQWFDKTTDATLLVGSTSSTTILLEDAGATIFYPNAHPENGAAFVLGITAVPATYEGLEIGISDGTDVVRGAFKVVTMAGLETPGDYKVVPVGYPSVSLMLEANKFYIAARGGYRDFPEMSLYGYGQSVLGGYGALEVSMGRSSDGVWFGLFDDTLDRVAVAPPIPSNEVSNLTWSEINSTMISGTIPENNNGQLNRPFMQLNELLDLYGATHVIFLDVRYAGAFQSELLGILDSYAFGTDRFVIKDHGLSFDWRDEAKLRGYTNYGYFHDMDSANLAQADSWDIVGLEYNAPQLTWDALAAELTNDQKIVAFDCPDLAAVNASYVSGAHGFLVSGVVSVKPTMPNYSISAGFGISPFGIGPFGFGSTGVFEEDESFGTSAFGLTNFGG